MNKKTNKETFEDDLYAQHEDSMARNDAYAAAVHVVHELSIVENDMSAAKGADETRFLDCVFNPIDKKNTTGIEQEKILANWHLQPNEMHPFALLQLIWISCAYAQDAIEFNKKGEESNAWRAISKAEYWLGVVKGAWSIRKDKPQSVVDFAKKGAAARHAETHSMKADVFTWLDENKKLNLNGDETAGEIAGIVVPIKWRTARDYITEWKKLRSAGRP